MEYRYFFPLLLDDDNNWISNSLHNEYQINLENLINNFQRILSPGESEKRVDEYFIGGDYVGVKNRVKRDKY